MIKLMEFENEEFQTYRNVTCINGLFFLSCKYIYRYNFTNKLNGRFGSSKFNCVFKLFNKSIITIMFQKMNIRFNRIKI